MRYTPAICCNAFPLCVLGFTSAVQAADVSVHARPLRLAETAATETVCARQAPSGWIKVDDAWNPTICGKPTSKTYNVWIIEQYSDKPVGAVMSACSGPAPAGWVVVDSHWNPTVCGRPANDQSNVMTIKRLN